jgi:hypothetical protein
VSAEEKQDESSDLLSNVTRRPKFILQMKVRAADLPSKQRPQCTTFGQRPDAVAGCVNGSLVEAGATELATIRRDVHAI